MAPGPQRLQCLSGQAVGETVHFFKGTLPLCGRNVKSKWTMCGHSTLSPGWVQEPPSATILQCTRGKRALPPCSAARGFLILFKEKGMLHLSLFLPFCMQDLHFSPMVVILKLCNPTDRRQMDPGIEHCGVQETLLPELCATKLFPTYFCLYSRATFPLGWSSCCIHNILAYISFYIETN